MAEPIIKLEHLNFWYDRGKPSEMQALKDISFDIEPGEYVAFFGPSGSGKTSLLYLIGGIEQSQDGKIFINGRDITKFSTKELAIYRQVGVGIVFQQFNLIPTLSVANNVALPMAFLGISSERRSVQAMELLTRLGIEDLAQRMPYELSGGQQQRVGIARALANNPPLIVADEPLGNLDSDNAEKVLEFLKELNEKDGRTIIMVTHEAWSLRDVQRIFYVKDGAILKTERTTPGLATKSAAKTVYGALPSESTPIEDATRSLSGGFLRGYSVDEMKRFEFFVAQRFSNELAPAQFADWLNKSWKEGGVGLWSQKARRIALYVEDIISRRKEISNVEAELRAKPESPLGDEIRRLRFWLLEGYRGRIDALQAIQIEELIGSRLRNIINPEIFKKTLYLPKGQSGVGLSFRTTERISEKLELILAGQEALPAISS